MKDSLQPIIGGPAGFFQEFREGFGREMDLSGREGSQVFSDQLVGFFEENKNFLELNPKFFLSVPGAGGEKNLKERIQRNDPVHSHQFRAERKIGRRSGQGDQRARLQGSKGRQGEEGIAQASRR